MDTPEKLVHLEASHGGRRFVIDEDPVVGFYIYTFEGDRCTRDDLQDTLEIAKQYAHEEFGVPEDAWCDATPTV